MTDKETIENLETQIKLMEETLDIIQKSPGNHKATKNHAKLILRQSRFERFLSNEHPDIYKQAQDFLNEFEEK